MIVLSPDVQIKYGLEVPLSTVKSLWIHIPESLCSEWISALAVIVIHLAYNLFKQNTCLYLNRSLKSKVISIPLQRSDKQKGKSDTE